MMAISTTVIEKIFTVDGDILSISFNSYGINLR